MWSCTWATTFTRTRHGATCPAAMSGGEPADLAGYRVRHALYKTDRDLQAAHVRHPFVAT